MAQAFDSEFGRLVIPGAYPSIKVQANVAGLASNGIVALLGEADAGMPGSSDDITINYFGPDQLAAVQAKYSSGPLVDAFRAVVAPANDPGIVGAATRIYLYKTNASLQSAGLMTNQGFGTFGTLTDQNFGRNGNLIYWKSLAAQAEVAPTTGPFSFIPSPVASAGALRSNGAAKQTFAISALMIPSALAATIDGLSGILCQGGVNRGILAGLAAKNITVAATGNSATFTLAAGEVFAATPVVGDTLVIAAIGDFGAIANSVFKGAANKNYGQWVVTAVSNTIASAYITALKIRNNAVGAYVAPENVGATPISVNVDDILVYSAMNISDVTGDDRNVLNGLVGVNASLTASGPNITFALAAGSVFAATPQVGDLVYISGSSAYKGAGSANVGEFEITGVSNTATLANFVATRLSNGNPITVVATPIVAVADVLVLRPDKAGLGKAIEIFDDAGAEALSLAFRQLGLATSVAWLSTSITPYLIMSASEYINQMNINRQLDNVSEVLTSGGDIALKVGYLGTTATLTVGATTITTSVVGGAGAALSITKADYPSLADLVAFINAQTGYVAALGSALMGQRSPADLDLGTFGICSSVSAASLPGRIKRDLADFESEISGSVLVDFAPTLTAGLPDVTAQFAYLAGGAKGGTTPASVLAGLAALEGIAVNFVVPLFSRDASADILDGLTESSSTYTIASVHAAVRSHVLAMSTVKRRKNRQGFLSIRDTFVAAKQAANNMASARLAMPFQDIKNGASDGTIKQFQPWEAAANAAGMQAAGFYKSICKKYMNVSGVLQAAGDFADNNDSQVEDALLNGLLPAERVMTGGYRWIGDQTTYGQDQNFVYNSIQAVYVADIVALSLAQRMENAFVGQTLGDVSAAAALGFIQAVMGEFMRLKLIGPSDDAPAGYKNVDVKIQGGAMMVSMEIKLATTLYFVVINFTVSQITQTATA